MNSGGRVPEPQRKKPKGAAWQDGEQPVVPFVLPPSVPFLWNPYLHYIGPTGNGPVMPYHGITGSSCPSIVTPQRSSYIKTPDQKKRDRLQRARQRAYEKFEKRCHDEPGLLNKRKGGGEKHYQINEAHTFVEQQTKLACNLFDQKKFQKQGHLLLKGVFPKLFIQKYLRYDTKKLKQGTHFYPFEISENQMGKFEPKCNDGHVGNVGCTDNVRNNFINKLIGGWIKSCWPCLPYWKVIILANRRDGHSRQWKECGMHLDYNGKQLEEFMQLEPAKQPLFMLIPVQEPVNLLLGPKWRDGRFKVSRQNLVKVEVGSILILNWDIFHASAEPDPRDFGSKEKYYAWRIHITLGAEHSHLSDDGVSALDLKKITEGNNGST